MVRAQWTKAVSHQGWTTSSIGPALSNTNVQEMPSGPQNKPINQSNQRRLRAVFWRSMGHSSVGVCPNLLCLFWQCIIWVQSEAQGTKELIFGPQFIIFGWHGLNQWVCCLSPSLKARCAWTGCTVIWMERGTGHRSECFRAEKMDLLVYIGIIYRNSSHSLQFPGVKKYSLSPSSLRTLGSDWLNDFTVYQ